MAQEAGPTARRIFVAGTHGDSQMTYSLVCLKPELDVDLPILNLFDADRHAHKAGTILAQGCARKIIVIVPNCDLCGKQTTWEDNPHQNCIDWEKFYSEAWGSFIPERDDPGWDDSELDTCD